MPCVAPSTVFHLGFCSHRVAHGNISPCTDAAGAGCGGTTSAISGLGRLKQEDLRFEASLVYTVRPYLKRTSKTWGLENWLMGSRCIWLLQRT